MDSIYPFPKVVQNIDPTGPSSNFSISPCIMNSAVRGGKYIFTFSNGCMMKDLRKTVNQSLLKTKLETWLKPSDRKYIKLTYYDTNRSIFEFNVDKWLDDSLNGVDSGVKVVRFQKKYRLRVIPPYMVRACGTRVEFENYIAKYFKEYCRAHQKVRKSMFDMVTSETERKMNLSAVNFFDYRYDYQSNYIYATLKPVYQAMVITAIVLAARRKDNNSGMGFDDSVRSNLKAFQFMSK